MSETLNELRRETEVAEIEIPLLERHLQGLHPRDRPAPWAEVDALRYAEDDFYRHEVATRRRDYLLGRFNEMRERETWRTVLAAARQAGIGRFLPGNYDLERLTRPEWERQMAVWTAAGSSGLSPAGAEEHQKVMREIRGDSQNLLTGEEGTTGEN
jgi:hypothetical protein